MEKEELLIICYGDNATLLAETKNRFQWLVRTCRNKTEKVNKEILTTKTKRLVISREACRCKLRLNNKTIKFRNSTIWKQTYQLTAISAVAARVAKALRLTIWKNACILAKTIVRLYKTCIRPVVFRG